MKDFSLAVLLGGALVALGIGMGRVSKVMPTIVIQTGDTYNGDDDDDDNEADQPEPIDPEELSLSKLPKLRGN